MNEFLPSRYSEIIHRLAVGIEPIDSLRQRRLSYELQIGQEVANAPAREMIERHTSNLFAVRYQKGVKTPIKLRFFDQKNPIYKADYDRRRVVPRRFSIPVLTRAQVEAAEASDTPKDFKRRVRKLHFYPGAAYDFTSQTTGLRGRITRGGKPMRWARIVATLAGQTVVVGRAHGDDRGEFLLLMTMNLTGTVPKPFEIEVSVFGPDPAPTPASPDLPKRDELWDLPLEMLANPGDDDDVASGKELPPNYTKHVTRVVPLTLGKCISAQPDFQIT